MYVAKRVGHAKRSTTQDIYAHVEKTDSYNLGEHFDALIKNVSDMSAIGDKKGI